MLYLVFLVQISVAFTLAMMSANEVHLAQVEASQLAHWIDVARVLAHKHRSQVSIGWSSLNADGCGQGLSMAIDGLKVAEHPISGC